MEPLTTITTASYGSDCSLPDTYTDLKANPSVKFVDSTTGACTNTIEGFLEGYKSSDVAKKHNGEQSQNGISDHECQSQGDKRITGKITLTRTRD
ncbi:hypothetical protein HZS_8112 [Henneguya salminicola]|nr:hypothetical protein HZS_8112 [Henneguya salminicola]